ncbi:leucyl aminopeptidase [Patescibacteria group bacterium]
MKISLIPINKKSAVRTYVLSYFQGENPNSAAGWQRLSPAGKKIVTAYFKENFSGQSGQEQVSLTGRGREAVLLLGLGNKGGWNQHRQVLSIRRIVQLAKKSRISQLMIWLDDLNIKNQVAAKLIEIVCNQAQYADYDFNKYKKKPTNGWPNIQQLVLAISDKVTSDLKQAVHFGQIIAEEANNARELSNMPGGEMTPTTLTNEALAVAKKYKLKAEILKPKQIEAIGMGGIVGVSRGSDEEPRFIILEYNGSADKKAKPIIIVGKGVTFDTGGLNVKPEDSMYEMHMDMAGAASAIHAIAAIARLKIEQRVVVLVPAVENMPSGSGYRPGDVLRSLSGKTMEVINTDAEGRLILADALTYAERYKPKLVIDLATLTGAAMVALGGWATALFTDKENIEKLFRESGEATGDYVWPLPLWEEYEGEVKGTFADVANIGKLKGKGGAITAAIFLKQFARKYPWVHLDIASTMTSIDGQYISKGATGAGLRVVVEAIRNLE